MRREGRGAHVCVVGPFFQRPDLRIKASLVTHVVMRVTPHRVSPRRRTFHASGVSAAIVTTTEIVPPSLTTQADSDNSICFGGGRWGVHLRKKARANSFANRESSLVLRITHVSKHSEVSESGFTTTPSTVPPTVGGFVRRATPTCSDTK